MKVGEVMTRDVKSCGPDDTLNTAARIMWENDCGCVPVVDRNHRLVGIVTDRDICMAAYTQGVSLHLAQVRSAAAPTVVSCTAQDDIQTAEQLMRENQVRRLPVTDSEGKLVGIISLNDISREAWRERQQARREVSGEQVAETLAAVCRPRSHALTQVAFGPEEGELEFRPSPPPKRR